MSDGHGAIWGEAALALRELLLGGGLGLPEAGGPQATLCPGLRDSELWAPQSLRDEEQAAAGPQAIVG